MKLDQLETFCALVESGGLEPAAQRVHRTQPAVSQQLKSLEQEFGHVLYERRQGRPTAAGVRLYERAKTVLAAGSSLRREMREFDESALELVIGASDTNALYFLPPYVRQFRAAFPKARLSVVCKPSLGVIASVNDGELDIGIVTLPCDAGGLRTRLLARQPLVLITPPDHALAKRKRIRVERLDGCRLVLLDETTHTGRAIEDFLAVSGFRGDIAMRSGSFEVIKRYVAEGVGVALVPERVLTTEERKTLGVVRIPGLPELAVGAVWRSGGHQPKVVAGFLELLRAPTAAEGRVSG